MENERRGMIDIDWGVAVRVWWAWLWRSMIIGVVGGGVFGAIIGVAGAAAGLPAQNIYFAAMLTSYVIYVPISIFFMGYVLKKKYKRFSIKIEKTE